MSEKEEEQPKEMTFLRFKEMKNDCFLYLKELEKGINFLSYNNPHPVRLQVLRGHLRLLLEENQKYFEDGELENV